MLALTPFLTKWGSLAAIFCIVHLSKTSGLLNQKNVTINWIVSSLHLVGFLKDFPFVEIWATLGGQPRVGREAFPPGASRAGGQHRGEAVSLSPAHFSLACCPVPLCWVQQQYLPPTLGDHTTGSGRWHNPVFERSALQWQPGTSATSAAPRLPGFGQWEDKKVKDSQRKKASHNFFASNGDILLGISTAPTFCCVEYFGKHPCGSISAGGDDVRSGPGETNARPGQRLLRKKVMMMPEW